MPHFRVPGGFNLDHIFGPARTANIRGVDGGFATLLPTEQETAMLSLLAQMSSEFHDAAREQVNL